MRGPEPLSDDALGAFHQELDALLSDIAYDENTLREAVDQLLARFGITNARRRARAYVVLVAGGGLRVALVDRLHEVLAPRPGLPTRVVRVADHRVRR